MLTKPSPMFQRADPPQSWRDLLTWARLNAGWLALAVCAALLFGGLFAAITRARYDECRAHGFSAFYCLGR